MVWDTQPDPIDGFTLGLPVGSVNVKDSPYFAKGDGVSDDTSAIQLALNAVMSIGGALYFPTGTYLISGTLTINGTVVVFGDGWGSILKVDSAAARFIPILVQGDSFAAVDGVVLRNFKVDGSLKGQLDAGLIQLNNAVGFLVDHLWVTNGGTPGESAVQGVNGIACSAGALGEVGSTGTIKNCLVEATTKAGINLSTESIGITVDANIVRDCTGNTQTPGIQVLGSINANITNNQIYRSQGVGLFVATSGSAGTYRNAKYPNITGNHIYSNGQGTVVGAGIFVANAATTSSLFGRGLISNNHIYSNGVNVSAAGIHLQNDTNFELSGNYIYRNSSAGVIVEAVQYVNIHHNIIDSNNTSNTANVSGVYLLAKATATLGDILISSNIFLNGAGEHQKRPVFFDNAAAQAVSNILYQDNYATGHETADTYGSTGTAPTNLVRDNAKLQYFNVKEYKAVGDGVTDDGVALTAALDAAAVNGGTVFVPDGTYAYATSPNFARAGVNILASRNTIFKHTGSGGNAFAVDGGSTGPGLLGLKFENITVQGNANSTYGFHVQSVHHSIFNHIRVTGCGTAYPAINVQWGVLNQWDSPRVSVNEGAFISKPLYGILFTRRGSGADHSAANVVTNGIFEGLTTTGGAGILIDYATKIEFIGGTSESNYDGVVITGNGGGNNSFRGLFAEANANKDIIIQTGSNDNAFYNLTTSGIIDLQGTAARNQFIGGLLGDVVLGSSTNYNLLQSTVIISGGSLTDNSATTRYLNVTGLGGTFIVNRVRGGSSTGHIGTNWGSTINILNTQANTHTVPATTNDNRTIGNPESLVAGQRITIRIKNTSGGALGTISFDTLYKLGAAWVNPANGFSRTIGFVCDGTNWIEVERTAVDVAN